MTWFKFEEKPPEKPGNYLVALDYTSDYQVFYFDGLIWVQSKYFFFDEECVGITHWTEIPPLERDTSGLWQNQPDPE